MIDVIWREDNKLRYDEEAIQLRFEELLKIASNEGERVGIYCILSTLLAKAEENVSKVSVDASQL